MNTSEALVHRSFEVDNPDLTVLSPLIGRMAGEYLDTVAPETAWLIPGLLPQGIPLVLASKGGLGKSWIALQACVALACGKPFLDFECDGQPRGAIYFGLEDGREVIHRRIQSIVNLYKQSGDWSDEDDFRLRRHFMVVEVNWEHREATTFLPKLIPNLRLFTEALASKGVPPGLIVLDTLARFSEGDENKVEALRPILQACLRLAHLGWTPLMIHPVGKGQDGARSKEKPSLADRMNTEWVRGSSAIVDNFRGVLQLVGLREDEADRAGLDADKARAGGYLVIGVTKSNGVGRPEWRLLEQSEAGAWVMPQGSHEALAKLRGTKAVESLSKQMAILGDLFHATRHGQEPDLRTLSQAHCGEAKDPRKAFNLHLVKLRGAGLIQKKGPELTLAGIKRVQEAGMEVERTTDAWN